MKRLKYLTVVLAALMLCLASCKKGDDGATGPAGSNGATGAQGPVGPAGPKGADGKDGSVIYSGNTVPSAATGVVGDFYLNVATGLLYGPKLAAGWGTGFSLKGPAGATGATGATGAVGATGATGATGAAGANGNTTLSGSGAPSASLGHVGDFYLDKGSYFLYGPKTGTGWGPAVNLQGPAGPVGPTGATGPAGTANVIYSGWNYAINFRDTTVDNSALKIADLAAPSLTTSILNSGNVMVYFTYGGGVLALPYTSNAGGKDNTISYFPRLGRFIITRFTADNSGSIPLSTLLQYRYVIIPGGISVAVAKHVNINDYESVRKFYMLSN